MYCLFQTSDKRKQRLKSTIKKFVIFIQICHNSSTHIILFIVYIKQKKNLNELLIKRSSIIIKQLFFLNFIQ